MRHLLFGIHKGAVAEASFEKMGLMTNKGKVSLSTHNRCRCCAPPDPSSASLLTITSSIAEVAAVTPVYVLAKGQRRSLTISLFTANKQIPGASMTFLASGTQAAGIGPKLKSSGTCSACRHKPGRPFWSKTSEPVRCSPLSCRHLVQQAHNKHLEQKTYTGMA